MADRKSATMAAAREKARVLDAERVRVEKLIEAATIAFHAARDDEQAAVEAIATAQAEQTARIGELAGLGISDDEIGQLCDLQPAAVRKARRAAATVRSATADERPSTDVRDASRAVEAQPVPAA